MRSVNLGLVGAGNIGKRHIMAIDKVAQAELVAIADPGLAATDLAQQRGIACFGDVHALISSDCKLDAVIIATPTERHHHDVMACLNRDIPVLVEKPIAASEDEAEEIAEMSKMKGCGVLVGHQRRYYPCAAQAKALIKEGTIGKLLGVIGQWNLRKDDAYYAPAWRRELKAGPILTNLIHEIDLLRFICGEITSVSAHLNHSDQHFEKEDTVALSMQFANQAVGTFLLSDRTPSPFSWEAAIGENLNVPKSGQNALSFMGSMGTLEFPNLRLWQHEKNPGDWSQPLFARDIKTEFIDAYIAQIQHLCDVVSAGVEPLINAQDGLMSLRATLAVARSAEQRIHIEI